MNLNVVDLTRRYAQDLVEIPLSRIRANNQKLSLTNANYLQEVNLGEGVHACYFKNGIPLDRDVYYYDMCWLNIPVGFEYLEGFSFDKNGTINSIGTSSGPLKDKGVLTPLLILQNDAKPYITDHGIKLEYPGNPPGCSKSILHKIDTVSYKLITTQSESYAFELFRYKGKLAFTNPVINQAKIYKIDRHEQEDLYYYLIPLVMSEKTIVYYAIQTDNTWTMPQGLINFCKTFLDAGYIKIENPLTRNDNLGIWVTDKATPTKV